jgi:hypothetical protein
VIGPDIYSNDLGFYTKVLNTYARPDNALWIPETGNSDAYARFLFLALNYGAIGFSPFGVDRTGWTFSEGEGPKLHTENFVLLEPISREIARLNFEGKLKAAVAAPGQAEQELDFGKWKASIRFGFPQPDGRHAPGTPDHTGGALVAELGRMSSSSRAATQVSPSIQRADCRAFACRFSVQRREHTRTVRGRLRGYGTEIRQTVVSTFENTLRLWSRSN